MRTSSVVLVDTSALLAAAHPRDQHHAEAVAIGRRFLASQGRWIGTTLALAELHNLLLHARGPALALRHVQALLADPSYEWLDVPAALVREAVERWLARFAGQPFSLTDAVSFEVMRRVKLRVAFAFGRHFVTAGFDLLGEG